MEEQKTGCLVCGAPLEYIQSQIEMECTYCHKKFMSNACLLYTSDAADD